MKKLFSLLLALTLVLSLVVVPARATEGVTASATKANLELNIDGSKSTKVTFSGLSDDTGVTYKWTASPENVVTLTDDTKSAATATAKAAGSVTLTCTATKDAQTVGTASCEVTVYDYKNAITAITYNNRSYNVTNNVDSHTATVNYVASEVADAANPEWGVSAAGYTATLKTAPSGKTGSLSVVYTVKSPADNVGQDVTVTANMTEVTAPTANISSPSDANNCVADQNVTFAVSSPKTLPTGASYVWTYKQGDKSSTASPQTLTGTQSGQSFTFKARSTPGDYTIYCAIKLGSNAVTVAGEGVTIKVTEDKNKYTVTAPKAATSELNGKTVNYGFKFENTAISPAVAIPLNGTNITWTVTGGSATFATKTVPGNSNGTAANTLTLGNTAGNVTVKATFTYLGKNYTVDFPAITNVVPTATLTAINCGGSRYYSAADLNALATTALTNSGVTGIAASIVGNPVKSVAVSSGSTSNVYATSVSGTTTFSANAAYLGQSNLTATVTRKDNTTYTMNIVVPVIPIYSQTFEAQYPQAVSAVGNTYNYTVTAPTGYDRIALITKGTTPTTAQLTTMPAYNSTSITLNSNDFNTSTGKCTLYVMAWNSNWTSNYYSTGKYYYGPLEVYQQNHDIKYNGVVGETVQFKHNSFTTFMNEMYGTNTTSYLTFNSVKFTSLPNATTQGTLYYNGSAMTTGYGSNYFNTSTAVTNLDNVSFAVSSKVPSTTKEIRIPFTLYATRYNSYGTSAGTPVTYSGAVVISLVREDVTFTVAPGDSVTFTDSAFLNYLRAQSGINYNYNIDYVTFDQSAVDTINGGVLYSGYAGFNAVKPTDRFYYTTTNNYTQNALSDVTFRASTYAKAGTTVYIPFTIYARYGTTGTGTRQVTGTVAVKIAQTMNFVDVKPTDYFYNPVKWAVGKNITKGTSAVTFSPDRTCTRAEIVTFLWRDAGSPMPTISRSPFSDVNYSMGADFYNAILWASQNGITAGTDVSHFSPNKTCTRAEIVTFLWRYAKKPVGYGNNSFTDVNKTDHAPYYDAILWAVSKGITNGSTTTTFAPDGTCTRGQAVTFLYRYEGGK